MGQIRKIAVIGLLIFILHGCGSLLTKMQTQQKMPLDRCFSITDFDIDAKQHLFLTLHDSTDDLVYEHCKINPDSIVCYIDGYISTPTLIINRVFVEQTEYRYRNQQLQRQGLYPPGTTDPNDRCATINYRVPVLVYRFTFPNIQIYESLIPEKLREKAIPRISTPIQLNSWQDREHNVD